ncbi:hypothetical protein BD779DRAFT_131207 [Infundibulicybe gibba]|nr:hypothetical protein BD779DRAFT_131207 [Infundibulicybe gibba]
MTWIAILCDLVATISVSYRQRSITHYTCPSPPTPSAALWTIHPVFIVGAFAAALGALGRLWCYNVLGRLFTFQVSIRQQHELITNGPYAWVRHPSYSALFLVVLGEAAVICAPGMWLIECGTLRGAGFVVLALWLLWSALLVNALANRLTTEEEALRKAFGSSWDEYTERVPYKLLPGLF